MSRRILGHIVPTARLLALLLLVICLLVSSVAAAGPEGHTPARSRVAIVIDEGAASAEEDASRRLRAEIEAQGFEVVTLVRQPGRSPVVEGAAPFSIISIQATSEGPSADVLILVADGAPVPLRVSAGDLGAEVSPAGLAIRVVERLRAGLFELAQSTERSRALPVDVAAWAGVPPPTPAPARAPASPPAPAERPSSSPRLEWRPISPAEPAVSVWLGLGVRSVLGYRGLPPALGPEASFALGLPERFSVGLSVAVPFGLTEVEGNGGTATTLHVLPVASAARSFDIGTDVVSPRVGVLAGAHVLRVEGEGEPGISVGRSAYGAAFVGGVDLGVDLNATSSVRVLADVSLVFVVPEPVVRIVREEAARGGFPMFGLSLGVQVSP
ncbi:MAG: hypothetical protein JNL21_04545 [Myxococcales bacterium]|nr:hypothetical protein [Myxococcales bacterium]